MLKTIALLAPLALIVAGTACGGASPSTTGEEEEGTTQATSADEATGDGADDEQLESSESELRGGGVRVGGVRWGGFRGGLRRGWVNGVWAPGWGWANGVWVTGGAIQYSCVTDLDCASQLGPQVAVCDFEPTIGLGQCVAPGWY